MGQSNSDQDDEITGINVTPFVDVMLVLLVIFMVTANYISNPAIAVNLPDAESTSVESNTKNIGLTLDAQGGLYFEGDQILFEDLGEKISETKKIGEKVTALIAADEKTPHGLVVKLIDVVRKNGITDFALNVEAPTLE